MAKQKKKNIGEIRKELEAILAGKEKEITDYNEAITDAKARVESAALDADKAYKALDSKGYHTAMDAKRTNLDLIEMYSAKVEEIKKTPYISKDDFERIADEITSCMDEYMDDAKAEYIRSIETFLALKNELEQEIKDVNDLLAIAQKKLLKQPCGKTMPNGEFLAMPWEERRYKNTALYEALIESVRHQYNYDLLLDMGHDKKEIYDDGRTNWL